MPTESNLSEGKSVKNQYIAAIVGEYGFMNKDFKIVNKCLNSLKTKI